jgi:hypothetical protein
MTRFTKIVSIALAMAASSVSLGAALDFGSTPATQVTIA